jgi:hypothetical protein
MRLRVAILICVLLESSLTLISTPIASADGSGVLISEIQTGNSTSASNEFVELYNATSADISLSGYTLGYHAASNTDCANDWAIKAKLAGTIKSHGFYLIASKDYLASATDVTATTSTGTATTLGLATDGGNLRLTGAGTQTADAVAWGKGTCGEGSPASASGTGHSLERLAGSAIETGGNAVDTGDNHADFIVRATPAPQSTDSATEVPADPALLASLPTPGLGSGTPAPLELNELLPDPASPLTDAKDEFVEIFNPNSDPVDLAGYIIKTGASLGTSHKLASAIVPAGGYLALKSGTTKIALANAGSSVALFNPGGTQLGATITYSKAKAGQAWARFDDHWQWTLEATPGDPNILDEPTATAAAAASKASKTKAAKAKAASSKTTKAKSSKAKTAKTGAAAPVLTAAQSPGGFWLLFALAGITIAYVIYEFRYDLRNFYFRLRGYPGSGEKAGKITARRGSNRAGERPGRGQNNLRPRLSLRAWLRRRGHQPHVHPQPGVQAD